MTPVEVTRGDGPVVLGMPHTGTYVPRDIIARLNEVGRTLSDTDWHIDRLYDRLLPGATVVRATFHRYVIDANRPPDGASLYPGQNTTGLCPVTDFDGRDIYLTGEAPEADEVQDRRVRFHAPYHAALAAEVERVRARHGIAVIYDCHSIRSRIPFLFEGRLPDFNIGTDMGRTADPAIAAAALDAVGEARGFSHVVNGRFRGGWTTRHYGRPAARVHAIQMELAQATHLVTEAPPFDYDAIKADGLRRILRRVLAGIDAAARTLAAA